MTLALAPAGVAAAYRAADALPQAQSAPAGGFGAALARAVDQAVEVGRNADAATSRALTGEGSVTDVVLAVGRAELTLQTAVAVRDRVVAAYQDVMRMPI
ncbi:flagellar hook-basal body complex protein FliE [Neoroseomonas oryzicola]|uniref:Flagellar hook-basal body complex protein FliE n=1 Tax=Neoroseomonas oryzicola TaxID=535904 RepID=A0A9X9WLB7_9PROT|nr:flagellar hook-basal body complex protein FliE [Neoroseomonas oryzicola]MBR0661127.1 flagellar hook-basal body complex protein FliE [Neoroseomonas oryzicola]NKE15892.1 flagellar hook-basal body complex protein FliE [Neoroseomonas oryzicola]